MTSAVLLFVIAWGSTVEATHGHAAANTNVNERAARSSIEFGGDTLNQSVQQDVPSRSSSRSIASSECLICQLHHNLATTLLAEPATVNAMHAQAARPLATAPIHLLEFATAQPGRAPPTSFLS